MPPAASLTAAADQCAADLNVRWQADTLGARVTAFAAALYSSFPSNVPNNAPIANWLAVIGALGPQIVTFANGGAFAGSNSLPMYQLAVDYVYRLCKLAAAYSTAPISLITGAQATAILNAYNAQFP